METFTPPQQNETPERILPTTPHLRYIKRTLSPLEQGDDETNWKNLNEKVAPWNSGLELANNVRQVVREYVLSKLSSVKEKIPSIAELPDKEMLNALANGWFEELGDEIEGKRKEVLLSVMAHIIRKIETRIYKKTLESAGQGDLEKLGLSPEIRQLAIDSLDATVKADPLFIRFIAYSQLSPKAPEDTTTTSLIGPDKNSHTFAELFPHETQFIQTKLAALSENSAAWENEPGANAFKNYVAILARFFGEKDTAQAAELHKEVLEAYNNSVLSDFPITIIPPIEGYYKPPYIDPELRVVVRTKESKATEEGFRELQGSISDGLGEFGIEKLSGQMKQKAIRSYIAIGSYGVNLTFVAAAQSEPAIAMYLDEQVRAYDQNLKKFLQFVDVPEDTFAGAPPETIEAFSRTDTTAHEISHGGYSTVSPEAEKLGAEQSVVIAETFAETLHRGMAQRLIENKVLPCNEEQYMASSICMALQSIKDTDPSDEYYQADVFVLNGLFEQGIAEFDGQKIHVNDRAAFFNYFKENAKKIIAVYEDPEMNPQKAKKWITENCTAGLKFQKAIDYIKTVEFRD